MSTEPTPEQLETLELSVGASGKVRLTDPVERAVIANYLIDAGIWVTWMDF